MIRVGVAGAAGRMGEAVCAAVAQADDMSLAGRADPALGTNLVEILSGCDVVVDFSVAEVTRRAVPWLLELRSDRPGRVVSYGV
jgi:4-hydroxy-tetrahydrodipicolinate reductase